MPAVSQDVFPKIRLAFKLRHCQVSAHELALLHQHWALPRLKTTVRILYSAFRNVKWMTLNKEFLSCFSWLLSQAWIVCGSWEDTLVGGSMGLVGGRGSIDFYCVSPRAEDWEPWEKMEHHSTTFVTFGNAERIVFSGSIFSAALMHFPPSSVLVCSAWRQ